MRKVLLSIALLLLAVDVFADDGEIRRTGRPVPNQYIVVLEEGAGVPDVPTIAAEIARENAGRLRHVFRNAFEGFSVEMTDERARAMSRDPRVRFVEQNGQIFLSAVQSLPTDDSLYNLDRLDQYDPYLNRQYTYWTTGAGVTAYVIDTGVRATHQEFLTTRNGVAVSRVVRGYDAVPGDGWNQRNPCGNADDYYCSHGTSVASVLGGGTSGVAKNVTFVPVRIARRNLGTVEDVIEGIDYGVLPDHQQFPGPAVANMSFFYFVPGLNPPGTSTITSAQLSSMELAVNRMIDVGITVVASANNQNRDACSTSPARLARGNGGRVISVGGSMLSGGRDTRWISGNPTYDPNYNLDPGSNYGMCVDLFAPSHNIQTAHTTGDTAYRTQYRSGTSFSSPQVAGGAALYLENATSASPNSTWNTLLANTNVGRLAGGPNPLNGSPDRLLFTNWSSQSPLNEGYQDGANCRNIWGWAWDRNQPNSPINVDLWDGGTWVTSIQAGSYRQDLYNAGKGNGYHAFNITTPTQLRNGQYHTVTLKYMGRDTNLSLTSTQIICSVTIFTTQTPAQFLAASPGYEVATQLSSSQNGYVTALRFYRAPGETGMNTLRLWTDTGTLLASGSVSGGSGWVEVDIPDISVTAGTRYRVSVNTNTYQSKTGCGLSMPIINGPLTAHQGFWGSVMGAFPTTASCSNFFVDVRFDQ